MPTQTSQLVTNLTAIYNEKLLIKQAIPTTSDNFSDYHTYIAALHPSGYAYITSNGDHNIASYEMVNVDVPIPSGYVLPSGTLEITENVIAADCSTYQYVTVDVESGSADPYNDAIGVQEMIENGDTAADYVSSCIISDFLAKSTRSYWKETVTINNEEKTVLFDIVTTSGAGANISSALSHYPDLYENIYPIVENATLTPSNDPSEDGYDYLLEGELYHWNLYDMSELVETITENGFISNDGALGFNVNVSGGSGGGLEEGAFCIFNFLEMGGGNNAKITMDNKPYEDLVLFNLEPINYMDSATQENTHNDYFEVELSKYSDFHDVVQFATLYSGVDDTLCQYYRFNNLSTGSNPQFKYIKATHYSWVSNFDPETNVDIGDWEQDGIYTGQFACLDNEDNEPYYITNTDEVVISIHNSSGDYIANLFINGEQTTENVTLTEVV